MAFVEHGLFRALAHCSVVALSDVVSVALVFNAFDKERHGQDILFHQHDLHASGVSVGQGDGREAWLQSDAFQPLRRLVEELNACPDWGEVVLATNLIIEPLLCRWIFNEALWANAGAHGDRVTPIVLAEAENDRVRNLAWTAAMVKLLLEDPEHGSHNRSLLQHCVESWRPLVLEAATALEQIVPTGTRPLAGSEVDRAWERWLSALCETAAAATC
jgi:methane monooxygenase component A beta chain/propane monooxygenase small subunit